MAVQYSPFGDTVFVVQNGKAVQRYVSLGEQRGSEIAVTRGISANEQIVSVGGNKLQNGTPITTKAALAAAKQATAEQKAQGKNNSSTPENKSGTVTPRAKQTGKGKS